MEPIQSSDFSRWRAHFALILLAWVIFTWQGWFSAIKIWWGNEIFNHGFFIIPGSIYLVYSKLNHINKIEIQPTLLPLIFIFPACVLFVAGVVGDVNLFQHAATFTLLPLMVWAMVGHKVAWAMLFPLSFIVFSIPVGEEIIPYLQEIAADGAVYLLHLVGIPLYRTGLYIEIPQGSFLVAEACSGISFLITSIAVGSVYAYLNFNSTAKRLGFFCLSITFPIIANVIRVFGIIVIAYLSDMEYAAGADHLIYGWFFFAFVIVCLLGIGEWLRDPINRSRTNDSNLIVVVSRNTTPLFLLVSLLVLCFIWLYFVQSGSRSTEITQPEWINFTHSSEQKNDDTTHSTPACLKRKIWKPIMQGADSEKWQSVTGENCNVTLYQAWFTGNKGELVSGLNRLFDPELWSFEGQGTISIGGYALPTLSLTTINDKKRLLVSGYKINGKVFSSGTHAKLYQVLLAMSGQDVSGLRFIISTNTTSAELEKLLVERNFEHVFN